MAKVIDIISLLFEFIVSYLVKRLVVLKTQNTQNTNSMSRSLSMFSLGWLIILFLLLPSNSKVYIYVRGTTAYFYFTSRLSFFFLFYKHQKLVLVEISLLLPICVWKAVYNIMFPSKQLSTLPKASSNHFNLIDWYKGSLHLATMKIIFCVLLFCTLVCGKKELQFSNICK